MDEKLHIRTSTGVNLDYELASLGDRVTAWLIDMLIILGYVIISQYSLQQVTGWTESGLIEVLFLLPALLYHFILETLMNGQSFGKRAREIQVVRLDGMQAGVGEYALRALVRILEVTLLQGALAMLCIVSSKYGQRLGDVAAGTTVIKLKKQVNFTKTLYREVEEDHEVRYPQVANMTNEEAETLSKLMDQVKLSHNASHLMRYAQKARKVLCTKLNIESEENDLDLLTALLNDYNYLQSRA
ncbi:MAG: RDD family protein [Bacteroidota bacterium]|nr:RDD family protein [Bacteroidota bacterium]MDX5429506.1 RDD family protein [Bacteroidota bacterium]MDX5468291.1 RDD family protein [Bacteroidota bacterium]